MIFPQNETSWRNKSVIQGTFMFNKDQRSPFWDILDFNILD